VSVSCCCQHDRNKLRLFGNYKSTDILPLSISETSDEVSGRSTWKCEVTALHIEPMVEQEEQKNHQWWKTKRPMQPTLTIISRLEPHWKQDSQSTNTETADRQYESRTMNWQGLGSSDLEAQVPSSECHWSTGSHRKIPGPRSPQKLVILCSKAYKYPFQNFTKIQPQLFCQYCPHTESQTKLDDYHNSIPALWK